MGVRTKQNIKNYYAVLELQPGCSSDEVRKAYRRLALRWHPDRNPGKPEATEQFKEISEAYGVLIDPEKRRQYDEARTRPGAGNFNYSQEDVLRDLFANRRASEIFEEIARELERRGLRVDRYYFERILSGGAIVSGGIFIIGPFTPVLGMFKVARAAVAGIARAARSLIGMTASATLPPVREHEFPLRLTAAEARQGVSKQVSVNLDGGDRNFLVKVPPGVRRGTRLRLRSPERTVYLSIDVVD